MLILSWKLFYDVENKLEALTLQIMYKLGVYINTGNKQIIAHIKQNKRDALMYDIYPQGINLTFIKNITMQNS